MALPADFPVISPVTFVGTGIIIGLAPTDPTFEMEIQRAPESSGAPGTPVTIARIPPFQPGQGTFYTDRLPITGANYYYRFRHVRTGWNAGPYGPWTRAATAKILPDVIPATVPIPLAPIPVMAAGTVGITAFDHVSSASLNTGKLNVVVNGDMESGLASWLGIKVSDLANISDALDAYNVADLRLETASPIAGAKSLKWTAASGLSTAGYLIQTTRQSDGIAGGVPLVVPIQSGERWRLRFSAKASTSYTLSFGAAFVLADGTLDTTAGDSVTLGTSPATFDAVVIPSPNARYLLVLFQLDPDAGKTVVVDDVFLWRMSPAVLGVWHQDTTVAANQSVVAITGPNGSTRGIPAPSDGVIANWSVRVSSARTAGQCSVTMRVAGITLNNVTIDGTHTQTAQLDGPLVAKAHAYKAGDLIEVVVTTNAGWLPTANNLDVTVLGGG